jgi:hypothetical protein
MREYRITRPDKYTVPSAGRTDLSARQGYYISAKTPDRARQIFRKRHKVADREPLDVEVQTSDGSWKLAVTQDAQTEVTTYDDSVFRRTALVVKTSECGSIDVLDRTGLRVAQINIFLGDDTLIIDTIDVDDMWPERMLITFRSPTSRDQILKAGTVNSVDFRRPKVKDAKKKAQGAWDNWTDEDRKTEREALSESEAQTAYVAKKTAEAQVTTIAHAERRQHPRRSR